ncbi:hypothetical protein F4Z99_03630 [Candidatus Poribacteria bacterium]|nr:hypothetical protein [Candidatus Poribacteria bacterium]MYA99508.1 hypothetical protein [Candidatus Poribacteria bacterium]
MKILAIGLLILVMMSGQLNADNHSAADNKITLNLDNTSEILVTGFIAPVEESLSDNFKQWDELVNLRVAEPEKQHPASVFQAFLPNKPVSVGDLWVPDMIRVVTLLRQLHPNPNFFLHINSGDSFGLWACLRAYNDQYADIVFRIHAEFKLKDGWFTPSQFTGHLVIDRNKEKVAFFEMYVPKGVINFDVNWKRGKGSMVTSTGFCSKMELRAGTQDLLENVEFTTSITQEAAERALILRFYKSQQINWVPLVQVLEIAQAQQKPIHVISIDGPLADESC